MQISIVLVNLERRGWFIRLTMAFTWSERVAQPYWPIHPVQGHSTGQVGDDAATAIVDHNPQHFEHDHARVSRRPTRPVVVDGATHEIGIA
jgi:hypothetical protein